MAINSTIRDPVTGEKVFGREWGTPAANAKWDAWLEETKENNPGLEAFQTAAGTAAWSTDMKGKVVSLTNKVHEGLVGGWFEDEDAIEVVLKEIGALEKDFPGMLNWTTTYWVGTYENSMENKLVQHMPSGGTWRESAGLISTNDKGTLFTTPYDANKLDPGARERLKEANKEHKEARKKAEEDAAKKPPVELPDDAEQKLLLQERINALQAKAEREKMIFDAENTPREPEAGLKGDALKRAREMNFLREKLKKEKKKKERDLFIHGREMGDAERMRDEARMTNRAVTKAELKRRIADRQRVKRNLEDAGGEGFADEEKILELAQMLANDQLDVDGNEMYPMGDPELLKLADKYLKKNHGLDSNFSKTQPEGEEGPKGKGAGLWDESVLPGLEQKEQSLPPPYKNDIRDRLVESILANLALENAGELGSQFTDNLTEKSLDELKDEANKRADEIYKIAYETESEESVTRDTGYQPGKPGAGGTKEDQRRYSANKYGKTGEDRVNEILEESIRRQEGMFGTSMDQELLDKPAIPMTNVGDRSAVSPGTTLPGEEEKYHEGVDSYGSEIPDYGSPLYKPYMFGDLTGDQITSWANLDRATHDAARKDYEAWALENDINAKIAPLIEARDKARQEELAETRTFSDPEGNLRSDVNVVNELLERLGDVKSETKETNERVADLQQFSKEQGVQGPYSGGFNPFLTDIPAEGRYQDRGGYPNEAPAAPYTDPEEQEFDRSDLSRGFEQAQNRRERPGQLQNQQPIPVSHPVDPRLTGDQFHGSANLDNPDRALPSMMPGPYGEERADDPRQAGYEGVSPAAPFPDPIDFDPTDSPNAAPTRFPRGQRKPIKYPKGITQEGPQPPILPEPLPEGVTGGEGGTPEDFNDPGAYPDYPEPPSWSPDWQGDDMSPHPTDDSFSPDWQGDDMSTPPAPMPPPPPDVGPLPTPAGDRFNNQGVRVPPRPETGVYEFNNPADRRPVEAPPLVFPPGSGPFWSRGGEESPTPSNTIIDDANKTTSVFDTPTPGAFAGGQGSFSPTEPRLHSQAEMDDIESIMNAEKKRMFRMRKHGGSFGLPQSPEERSDRTTREYMRNRVPGVGKGFWSPEHSSFPKYTPYGNEPGPRPQNPYPYLQNELKIPSGRKPDMHQQVPPGAPHYNMDVPTGPMGPQGYIPHPAGMGEREGALNFRKHLRDLKNPVLPNLYDEAAFA